MKIAAGMVGLAAMAERETQATPEREKLAASEREKRKAGGGMTPRRLFR
jgi:hypothetical protein